ncbi:MAG: ornithine carbamoyltransferase [Desulfatibacillaceae bacterium]
MIRHITNLWDLSKDDMDALFASSARWKNLRKQGKVEQPLVGRSMGLMFNKPSTRTRLSFEAAMIQLGGAPIFMSIQDTQLSRDEPPEDTARVLSRYLDALVVRTYSQEMLVNLAKASDIPVINALTDLYHPCQILSDIFTVIEEKGGYEGVRIVWVGDGNNVCHSWIIAAAVLGLDLVCACPEGHMPLDWIVKEARDRGAGRITITSDPREAARGADVLYTDVWASMGQEQEAEARRKVFAGYQINDELVALAKMDVTVMHCLPAHREEEITDSVLEGPRSVVWDQAENKMHMHKAILEACMTR